MDERFSSNQVQVLSIPGQNGGGEFTWTATPSLSPSPQTEPSPRSPRSKSEAGDGSKTPSLRRNAIMRKIFEQMDRQDETTRNYEKAINEAKNIHTLAPPALCRKKSNSLPDLARLHEQGLGHLLLQSHDGNEAVANRAASPVRRSHVSPRVSPYPSVQTVWPHHNITGLSTDTSQQLSSSLPRTTTFPTSYSMPQFTTVTPTQTDLYSQGFNDNISIPSFLVTGPQEEASASLLWNEIDTSSQDCTSVESLTDILASLIEPQGPATSVSPKAFHGFSHAAPMTSNMNTTVNGLYNGQQSGFLPHSSFAAVNGQPNYQQMQNQNYGNTIVYGNQTFNSNQYVNSTSNSSTAPASTNVGSSPYLWIPPTRARVSSMPSLRHFSATQTDTAAFCGGVVEDLGKPQDSILFSPSINNIQTSSPLATTHSSYHTYDFYNQGILAVNTKENETFFLPAAIQTWNTGLYTNLNELKFGHNQDMNGKAQETGDYMERLRLADNYVRKELGIQVSDPDFL